MLEKKEIKELSFPVDGYNYNVQILRSVDGGKTWWYTGLGKYFRTLEEAQEYANPNQKRLEELEKMLEEVCGQYEDDCSRCPRRKECEEYCKIHLEQHKTK